MKIQTSIDIQTPIPISLTLPPYHPLPQASPPLSLPLLSLHPPLFQLLLPCLQCLSLPPLLLLLFSRSLLYTPTLPPVPPVPPPPLKRYVPGLLRAPLVFPLLTCVLAPPLACLPPLPSPPLPPQPLLLLLPPPQLLPRLL